jgi:hypothetical protein
MERTKKIVFRFVIIFNEKSTNVYENHRDVQRLLEQIQYQHETAAKLEKELQHEKIVLEERLKVYAHISFLRIKLSLSFV